MNIQKSVEQGILRAVGKIGMCAVAAYALVSAAPKVINASEEVYNDVKDRIKTEQAIRAEGIQAQSYTEAKMKLDSINLDRTCKELGVPVPQKPATEHNVEGMLKYYAEVSDIYDQAIIKNLNQILQKNEIPKE